MLAVREKKVRDYFEKHLNLNPYFLFVLPKIEKLSNRRKNTHLKKWSGKEVFV